MGMRTWISIASRDLSFIGMFTCVVALGCAGDSPSTPAADNVEVDPTSTQDAEGSEEPDVLEPLGPRVERYDFSLRPEVGDVRAGVIEATDALLAGPKSEGRLGDIRIDNHHVAFVVEGVRRASGYSYWGGNVTDVSLYLEDDSLMPDQFGELLFGWNLDLFKPESVEIIDDGRTSGGAHVRFVGRTYPFAFTESFIGGLLNLDHPQLALTYDYELGPEDTELRLTITLYNDGVRTQKLPLPVMMASFGDGAMAYTPGYGFDYDAAGLDIPYYVASGRDLGYGFHPERQDLVNLFGYAGVTILQMDELEVRVGQSEQRRFWFSVSDNGPAGIANSHRALVADTTPLGTVSGQADLPDSAQGREGWVSCRLPDGTLVTTAPLSADGSFSIAVPHGEYELVVHVRDHAASTPLLLNVDATPTDPQTLEVPASIIVDLEVRDADGEGLIPARVTFIRQGDTPSPKAPADTDPRLGSWGGTISAVGYATGGTAQVALPPGTYQVTASRGFSYELDQRVETITSPLDGPLTFSLQRAVDTTGWLSADFHIHAWWSPDSNTPWSIRAKQAATENVDLPILTEHVYIGSLTPEIDAQGVHEHVIGVTAQEVTSFTHGHFNAFPLVAQDDKPNRGGVFPYDKKPIELFEAIRDQHEGDEIIQVNHPRGQPISGYFSHVGLDAQADTVAAPYAWSTNWDAIEVFNGNCGKGEVVDDWIGLTNHGYAKTLASGSDSHTEARPIGMPRNWIKVDESAVRSDPQSLVQPVRERRLFVSCGPFVRFTALGADDATNYGLGELAPLGADGTLTLHASVEAPTWMSLTEVRLWENGQVIESRDISASDDPVLRFNDGFTVTPVADAWYALEVLGTGSLAPVTWSGSPYALTNPIEVDADGDGDWTPPGG